jgi:hypothetical protein
VTWDLRDGSPNIAGAGCLLGLVFDDHFVSIVI